MRPLTRIIDHLLNATLVVLMAALVINVLWQVGARFLLDDPSSFTEEIARFLLLWIGLLGGCYAYRQGSHLGLDLLTAGLEGRARYATRLFVLLVSSTFAAVVLGYGGGRLVWLTLDLGQTSPALGLPMGLVYGVLPLSGALLVFYSVVLWRESSGGH